MTDVVSKKQRSEIMRAVKSKDSEIEVKFRKVIWKAGFRYRKNSTKYFGKPDLVLKKYKTVIFIDSCFWHGCKRHCRLPLSNKKYWIEKIERNKKRDRGVNRYYKKQGWKVIRVWEHKINNNFNRAISRIIMSKNLTNKEITDYFRVNIYESFSAYNTWKMIFLSKSKKVVSEEMAKRYVEIQKYHKDFFVTIERSCLVHFVLMSLHSFDRRDDSYSLYKVNQKGTETFVKNNKKVIKALRGLRNKLFAHKDANKDANKNNQYKIPSVISLDAFFKNLMEFYNKLTSKLYSSSTSFSNAKNVKRDIELLFMNLYRGEAVRKKEIDIRWPWEESNKKASDVL